ncbi:hypothetical protein [Streptomyces marincola]|uniref:hypothetical protein n=1 Tax=Streptomyces marincola TaxID=2878388 RepID=UPI001CF56621|nr:hypothetical protein [Streptomyces marincola]UCM87686.1 hypothetical protein LC193_06845 [Streptomyces marincola]
MAKTHVSLMLEESAAEMARQAARARRVPVDEYVERLIRADEEVRGTFLAGAQKVLDSFGDLIDGIDGIGEDTRGRPSAPGPLGTVSPPPPPS